MQEVVRTERCDTEEKGLRKNGLNKHIFHQPALGWLCWLYILQASGPMN